jgi:hypothetical protein
VNLPLSVLLYISAVVDQIYIYILNTNYRFRTALVEVLPLLASSTLSLGFEALKHCLNWPTANVKKGHNWFVIS